MKRVALAIGLGVLAACAQEKTEEAGAPMKSDAVSATTFELKARDRQLAGIEGVLNELGFEDTARFYDGPEFSLVSVRVRGDQAIAAWERLRREAARTQAWPVIIGETGQEEQLREHLGEVEAGEVERSIRAALKTDFGEWLRKRRASEPEVYAPSRLPPWRRPFRKRCPRNDSFTIHTDIVKSEPHPRVSIVLVPTTESWQVAGFLQYGGWNDCPLPSEQVAAHRDWHYRFGAEVLGMGSDIVELVVGRPVEASTAMQVADEQFVYCYDIVDQGTGTLDCLADTISGAKAWYFWWD